jgi:hypothetical protein
MDTDFFLVPSLACLDMKRSRMSSSVTGKNELVRSEVYMAVTVKTAFL